MCCVLFPSKVLMSRKEDRCWKFVSQPITPAQLEHLSTERKEGKWSQKLENWAMSNLGTNSFFLWFCPTGVEL